MAEERTGEAALDLLWSLWSELGIPGPRRSHPEYRVAAEPFFGELAGAGVRWVRVPSPPASRPRESRTVDVALERPALLRLRMRAVAGVGGRADVLVAMLEAWTSAAQLGEVGLAKRNVARVLAELAEAGIATARQRGNVREFRLARPDALGELVALPRDAVFPDWRAVFDWMWLVDELVHLSADRPTSRWLEVARRRKALVLLSAMLGFGRPAGDDADSVVTWAVAHARALADGTAPAVGGPARGDPHTARRLRGRGAGLGVRSTVETCRRKSAGLRWVPNRRPRNATVAPHRLCRPPGG